MIDGKKFFYAYFKSAWIAIIGIWLFLLVVGIQCRNPISSPKHNVLLILVDDLGWNDLGCYGSSFHETPRLDAFAQESFMFTNAYSASPVCSPTRAAIMTGKNPVSVNITDWIKGRNPRNQRLKNIQDLDQLPLEEYTIAEALKDNGYHTFFAGKWHLGGEGYFPEDQGFEINIGGHERGSPPGGYYAPYKNPKMTDGPQGEYLPDRLTDECLKFIQKQEGKENPFFAMLSFYTVHTPIQACDRYLSKYQEKRIHLPDSGKVKLVDEGDGSTMLRQVRPDYASMVEAMDENVGRLLQGLKDQGIWDNTIVIFTSDNGGLSTLNKNRVAPTSVRPLRAGKGWCNEGGIRVPLLVHMPGITKSGARSDVPVVSHDFFPTLANQLKLDLPEEVDFDGRDITPIIQNKEFDREFLIWHYPHYHGSMWRPGAGIRQGNWKLVIHYETNESELYNLESDIEEQNDLSLQFPDKKSELFTLLQQRQVELGAKFPEINEEYTPD